MNLTLLPRAFDCLRKGGNLANPALWKVVGLGATGGSIALVDAIADFLMSANALAQGLGYDVHLTQPVAHGLGLAVAWAVGLFFTVATTDKLGVLPAKRMDAAAMAGPAGDAAAGGDAPAAAPVGSAAADGAAPGALRPVADGSQDGGGYLRG